MVWRGEQYQRAIGMYFTKFGRYPTKIDDLAKQTNGIRFLRQAYTDPMNKEDGSWRFIYVGPNGQLIGSLRQHQFAAECALDPGTSRRRSATGFSLRTHKLPLLAGANPGPALPVLPGQSGQQTKRLGAHYLGAQSLGVPTSATPGQRHRWKHHWRWKQGKATIAARLPRRRHVRAVGIHLESSAANCNSWTTSACEPECARRANRATTSWATRSRNAPPSPNNPSPTPQQQQNPLGQ